MFLQLPFGATIKSNPPNNKLQAESTDARTHPSPNSLSKCRYL